MVKAFAPPKKINNKDLVEDVYRNAAEEMVLTPGVRLLCHSRVRQATDPLPGDAGLYIMGCGVTAFAVLACIMYMKFQAILHLSPDCV